MGWLGGGRGGSRKQEAVGPLEQGGGGFAVGEGGLPKLAEVAAAQQEETRIHWGVCWA